MINNRNPGDRLAIKAAEWNEIARVVNTANAPSGGAQSSSDLVVKVVNKGTTAIVANGPEPSVVVDTLEYVSPRRDVIVVGAINRSEIDDEEPRPRINVQITSGIDPGETGDGIIHGRITVLDTNADEYWYLDEDMAFADTGSFVIGGSVVIGSVNYYLIERLGVGSEDSIFVTSVQHFNTTNCVVGSILEYRADYNDWVPVFYANVNKNTIFGVVVSRVIPYPSSLTICVYGKFKLDPSIVDDYTDYYLYVSSAYTLSPVKEDTGVRVYRSISDGGCFMFPLISEKRRVLYYVSSSSGFFPAVASFVVGDIVSCRSSSEVVNLSKIDDPTVKVDSFIGKLIEADLLSTFIGVDVILLLLLLLLLLFVLILEAFVSLICLFSFAFFSASSLVFTSPSIKSFRFSK